MSFSHIVNESVRFFVFQVKDMATFPELQAGYVTALLIDKLNMNPDEIKIQSCYPYNNYMESLIHNINRYPESCYFFFLENFYHSNVFILKELKIMLSKIKDKKIYIHSFKINEVDSIQLMKDFPSIELIIRTDSEYVLNQELLNNISLSDIANIVYRKNGIPVITKHEEVNYDLKDYILPAYTNGKVLKEKDDVSKIAFFVDDDDEYTDVKINNHRPKKNQIESLHKQSKFKAVMLTSGRGCKYKCTYCFRGVKYSSVRQIPLNVIEADMKYLKSVGFLAMYFYDDCFITTNNDRLDDIIALMKKYDFLYYIAIRYEACTPEILNKLSCLKFYRIQVGLQTIKHNSAHKRSFNHDKLIQVMEKLKNANIAIDIILGLPGETKQDFMNTVQYAISLSPSEITVNTLFLNPGTELSNTFKTFGIQVKNSKLSVPYIIESDTFSKQDLNECRNYLKDLIDEFPNIRFVIR